jgi:type II secretory pathway component GspD/PulD (secretin)
MTNKKIIIASFFLLICCFQSIFPQETAISLNFRNQKITDILLSLADVSNKSLVIDESVSGNASFNFSDTDFETALVRFTDYTRLFFEKKDGVYYISRIQVIQGDGSGLFTVNAEDVMPSILIRELSRKMNITIMSDTFPAISTTIRIQNASPETVLRLITSRYDGYELTFENGGFFIRNNGISSGRKNDSHFTLSSEKDLYSLSAKKVSLTDLITTLFKKSGDEYSLITKNNSPLENLYYEKKDFKTLLQLILDQAGCDFTVKNNIYYIFDLQQKDISKQLSVTQAFNLHYLSVTDVQNLFPSALNTGSIIKADKNTNTFYITGSPKETEPVINFLKEIDTPLDGRFYGLYTFSNIPVSTAIPMIPKTLFLSDAVIIPNTSSFVTQTTHEKDEELKTFITKIDVQDPPRAVRLKYIKSSELVKFLPPAIDKNRITVTGDNNVVFFTGNDEQYSRFIDSLTILDQPDDQIRYQLLVVQYQNSDNKKLSASLSLSSTSSSPSSAFTATLTNLFNINFDVVSQFGIQAAASFNAEITENRAKVLADTTLNGISGQDISFENKNIYRYRDIVTGTSSDTYTSIVREISTGLVIKINGWVSGDEMITVNVTADLSKQGSTASSSSSSSSTTTTDTTPPSTSEKTVTTNVRTNSGVPIIISGLLQSETDKTETRVPVLGSIPLLGALFRTTNDTLATTELVIYLVPFVEHSGSTALQEEKNIRSLYDRYVTR